MGTQGLLLQDTLTELTLTGWTVRYVGLAVVYGYTKIIQNSKSSWLTAFQFHRVSDKDTGMIRVDGDPWIII